MDEKKPVAFSTGEEEKEAVSFDMGGYLEEKESDLNKQLEEAKKERLELEEKRKAESGPAKTPRDKLKTVIIYAAMAVMIIALGEKLLDKKAVAPVPEAVVADNPGEEVEIEKVVETTPAEKKTETDKSKDTTTSTTTYETRNKILGDKGVEIGSIQIDHPPIGEEIHVDGYVLYNSKGDVNTDYFYMDETPVLLSPPNRELVAVLYEGKFSLLSPDFEEKVVDPDVKKILLGDLGIFYLTNEGSCRFLSLNNGKIYELDTGIVDFCPRTSKRQAIVALKNDNENYYGELLSTSQYKRLAYEGNYTPVLRSDTWTETYLMDGEGSLYQHNSSFDMTLVSENAEIVSAATDGNTLFVRNKSTQDVYYFYSSFPESLLVCSGYDEGCFFMDPQGTASFIYLKDGDVYMNDIPRNYKVREQPALRYSLVGKNIVTMACDGDKYGNAWYYSKDGSLYYGYKEVSEEPIVTGISCKAQTLKLDPAGKACFYLDGSTICRVGTEAGTSQVVATDVREFTEIPGKEDALAYLSTDGTVYYLFNGEFISF